MAMRLRERVPLILKTIPPTLKFYHRLPRALLSFLSMLGCVEVVRNHPRLINVLSRCNLLWVDYE